MLAEQGVRIALPRLLQIIETGLDADAIKAAALLHRMSGLEWMAQDELPVVFRLKVDDPRERATTERDAV